LTTNDTGSGSPPEGSADHPSGSSTLSEKIKAKITELAALLEEADRSAQDQPATNTGAGIADRTLQDLSPAEQGALLRAFGSDMRTGLLRVFLEATGEEGGGSGSAAQAEERVSNTELVALVARLFRQFLSIETAVVAISTEFMQEGQKVKLPGHFANLRGYVLQLIHDGGVDSVDKINEYLGDINRWIAASLKAWELAPDRWWTEWWDRISPRAIEEKARVGFMGNKYNQFWKLYREMFLDLTPPEAKSQIFEIAGKIARETMS